MNPLSPHNNSIKRILLFSEIRKGFLGGSVIKNLPASAGDAGNFGSIPGSGRSPGGGNGNPLQYSCLGNPTDRAWQKSKATTTIDKETEA